MLLGIGAFSVYQNVVVRTSLDAVINARIVAIRAPIDGIVSTSALAPGHPVQGGIALGQIEDPRPDDARHFALQQELAATQREREALSRREADLARARYEADAQAEAYRRGRIQQDELRVEEAEALLGAATAREADAAAAVARGAALHARGFQSDEAFERARHTRETAHQDATAAKKRLDALRVELLAARAGTYLGDNYNDAPSSFQRARELTVRIDETRATLDQLADKAEAITARLAAEQVRLAARSAVTLSAPVSGNLWTAPAVSGEYVRKGQELLSVVDCSTTLVTAAVSARDYNHLRPGDPVRFRVAGTGREYAGSIAKLGLTSTGTTFAISPEEHHYRLAVSLPELVGNPDDGCAIGRSGEIVFDSGRGGVARAIELINSALGRS